MFRIGRRALSPSRAKECRESESAGGRRGGRNDGSEGGGGSVEGGRGRGVAEASAHWDRLGSNNGNVLTSISRARVFRLGEAIERQVNDEGIPKVDTSPWLEERQDFSENFVEQRVPLKLVLGSSTATLWLSETSVPTSWQGSASVIFGISEDEMLCCIEVRSLTGEQLEMMMLAD